MTSTFLAQNLKSDTFELQYDLSKRLSGRVGYVYTNRTIADFDSTFMTAETYFPGGAGGTAENDFFAARGDCAVASACTPGANGSLIFSGPAAGNDTSRNLVRINENALLVGLTARPMDSLRITGDFEFGNNDNSFTRTDPQHVESYKIHGSYRPRPWVSVDGAVDIHENQNNVYTVNNQEHDRMYSVSAMITANPRLSFNFGYNNWDVIRRSTFAIAPESHRGWRDHAMPDGEFTCSARGPGGLYQRGSFRLRRSDMESVEANHRIVRI